MSYPFRSSFLLATCASACAILVGTSRLRAQPTRSRADSGVDVLTLRDAVRGAVTTHPRIFASQRRVDAAQGSLRTARAWMNPSLTVQQEGGSSMSATGTAMLEKQRSAFAMVPLAPLYQRGPMSRMSASMVDMARADLARTRQDVALDAARAFTRAALAQIELESATDVRSWLDSLVAYTAARVTEGVAAEGDLLRLTVEADRAAIDVTMKSTEARRARVDLAALLSFTASDDRRLRLSIDFSNADSNVSRAASLDDLIALARRQRADLAVARARIDEARADRSLQRAEVFRDLSGMVGTMSMGGERSLMAGVTVTLPAFNQNRGEVQRASAEIDAATFEAAWADRQAVAEVTAAFEAAHALRVEAARLQSGFLARAEESRRIALGTYREGAAPLFVVIEAARSFSEARTAYYHLLSSRQLSILELNAAIGAEDLLSPLPGIGR